VDRWQTYPIEFRGGLISNLSPLQHGLQAPGSARLLRNFEPSVEGGYRRIQGFSKFSDTLVPSFGSVVVQGSGQSGTTLIVSNIFIAPEEGDTLIIAGVTGTYTIATGGVVYSNTNKTATLTLVETLDSSPADKAAVTFNVNRGLIRGVAFWQNSASQNAAIAVRNNNVYTSTGTTWTRINVPVYGSVEVDGATQTGASLIVDGLTGIPQVGDTFTIAGVELVYTVLSVPTVTSGGATLSISPSLDSSPADDASITFLTSNRTSTEKNRFTKYRIGTTEKIASVDGVNKPFIWDGTTYNQLNNAPSDVVGASHVVWHKNQLFFAKGDVLTFTSPYTDTNFNPANGAGNIAIGSRISGIIPFREQLIIFSENKISRLVGNTLADFVLQPITDNIGCVDDDTIREVGSDVMFLGPDGLRLLSATDRIGDFNIAVVSKPIQKEMTELINSATSFTSVSIKKKSQYRLLGYKDDVNESSTGGIIGAQLLNEESSYFAWAQLRGIKAFVADTLYKGKIETVVFAGNTGYVYRMESGNSFDGQNIPALFATPYVPIQDPQVRKTFYKMALYTDPDGGIDIDFNLRLDFNQDDSIQPDTIKLSNVTDAIGIYSNPDAFYGTAMYGGKLINRFLVQVIGSGFTVSLRYECNDTNPPFSLDAATLEYALFDRR
jgi:hypothetical protein